MDNAMRFAITYPLDSDLSVGYCYPPFIQLGPGVCLFFIPLILSLQYYAEVNLRLSWST